MYLLPMDEELMNKILLNHKHYKKYKIHFKKTCFNKLYHTISPDTCLLLYGSATPEELIGFTVVYVNFQ